jgi:hypothetical protein
MSSVEQARLVLRSWTHKRKTLKWMIAGGMWIQAVGICLIAAAPSVEKNPADNFRLWLAAVLLGLGTALVYPTLLAA